MKKTFLLFVAMGIFGNIYAQDLDATLPQTPTKKAWYDKFSIRGYAQARYNGLFQTNPDLECDQCDSSWGGDREFFMRRIRIIFFGQISERVYFYIQPDFASAISSTNLHGAQIRDAYFDVGLDKKNEFRFRIGQSKVPYGFENMQSSSNRLPLDRNDPLNSAVKNERDLGVFFYWAPHKVRELFSTLNQKGLKHSGDYGAFGFGAYNGQTANRPELNDNKHIVARFSYPIEIGDQVIEPGIQAYTGKYTLFSSNITPGVNHRADRTYIDRRVAATFVLYPQPFGIQAEYNVGEGPEYNKYTNSIEVQDLHGGYVTFSYLKKINDQIVIPFTRLQYYNGGKKFEQDARSYLMNEVEVGIEWQPVKAFELVAMYTISSRRFEDAERTDNLQEGRLVRLQAQVNF